MSSQPPQPLRSHTPVTHVISTNIHPQVSVNNHTPRHDHLCLLHPKKPERAREREKAFKCPLRPEATRSQETLESHKRRHQGQRKVLVQQGAHSHLFPNGMWATWVSTLPFLKGKAYGFSLPSQHEHNLRKLEKVKVTGSLNMADWKQKPEGGYEFSQKRIGKFISREGSDTPECGTHEVWFLLHRRRSSEHRTRKDARRPWSWAVSPGDCALPRKGQRHE